MKKLFILLLSLFTIINIVFAQEVPDGFSIQISPEEFKENEAVDLTITAIKNSQTLTDYVGDVIIDILELNSSEYTVPNGGLYTFEPQDQGSKTFSKGLQIYKPGTFTLRIVDITNDSAKGETTIIIGNGDAIETKDIDIISPIAGGIETEANFNIIGSSIDLPKTTVSVYLNKELVTSTRTDIQGEFNIFLDANNPIQDGINELQIKALDSDGKLIGQSDIINFSYEEKDTELFKSIEINPSTIIKQGDQIEVIITVAEAVSSVKLTLSDGKEYPMDKQGDGVFDKSFTVESIGIQNISLSITADGEEKIFSNIESLVIESHESAELTGEIPSIENIKIFVADIDGSSINIFWDPAGDSGKYRLAYGTGRNTLANTLDVDTNKLLIEQLDPQQVYYFQITILDVTGHEIGKKSQIIEYKFGGEETCVIEDITVETKQEGDKYYLVRDSITGANKYEIYKTDFADENTLISDMKKITETTGTNFEYPFNPKAEKDEYAYYAVVAICGDGNNVQIGNIQKVQVGPFDNLILVLILAGLIFSVYKIYKHINIE